MGEPMKKRTKILRIVGCLLLVVLCVMLLNEAFGIIDTVDFNPINLALLKIGLIYIYGVFFSLVVFDKMRD